VSNKHKRAERTERASQQRRERELEQQRRARIIVTVIVAVVVLIVVVVAVAIIPRLGEEGPTPSGITAENGIRSTAAQPTSPTTGGSGSLEPVQVVVYEDFHCPSCKEFESSAGGYLQQQVDVGAIEVEYRPIAILDRVSSTDYSTRSAGAAACVLEDADVATFVTFHDALFANQPAEGGPGLSGDDLVQIAEQSGASGDVGACISNGTYEDWTARATEAASQDGVVQTPTVRVNGTDVIGQGGNVPSAQDLMAAISEARDATPAS